MKRNIIVAPLLILTLLLVLTAGAGAQVATLRTPSPDAEAILEFVACLRENGIDVPDPQFGAGGTRFGADPEALARIDLMSREFLDAVEACQHLLDALQPELDPQQVAEQNEQLLEFAECMRGEGIDFPDPDPIRGFTMSAMRGEDGELVVDPFSAEFQAASVSCFAELDLEMPVGPGA